MKYLASAISEIFLRHAGLNLWIVSNWLKIVMKLFLNLEAPSFYSCLSSSVVDLGGVTLILSSG